MGTAQRDRPRPRVSPPRASPAQRQWIVHRDRVGEVIDSYLRTRPAPEMREAIAELEASLALGDHAVGLL
ncbi:MAG: hypothetical protein ACXVSF_06450 [Solirubrobacteraceae bacterium]